MANAASHLGLPHLNWIPDAEMSVDDVIAGSEKLAAALSEIVRDKSISYSVRVRANDLATCIYAELSYSSSAWGWRFTSEREREWRAARLCNFARMAAENPDLYGEAAAVIAAEIR
ncbi:hypothetical protein VR010_14910 [Actinomycetaceae bacterium L2_0104]